MAKYYLTNKAVEDLPKIWDYTFEQWSERQADKYYEMLITNCEEIVINPKLGKKYEGITPNLLGLSRVSLFPSKKIKRTSLFPS